MIDLDHKIFSWPANVDQLGRSVRDYTFTVTIVRERFVTRRAAAKASKRKAAVYRMMLAHKVLHYCYPI